MYLNYQTGDIVEDKNGTLYLYLDSFYLNKLSNLDKSLHSIEQAFKIRKNIYIDLEGIAISADNNIFINNIKYIKPLRQKKLIKKVVRNIPIIDDMIYINYEDQILILKKDSLSFFKNDYMRQLNIDNYQELIKKIDLKNIVFEFKYNKELENVVNDIYYGKEKLNTVVFDSVNHAFEIISYIKDVILESKCNVIYKNNVFQFTFNDDNQIKLFNFNESTLTILDMLKEQNINNNIKK